MLSRMPPLGRRFLYLALGMASTLMVALLLYVGFTLYTEYSDIKETFIGGVGVGAEYLGQSSLEERIAWVDVIARARLTSVSSAAEQLTGETGYVGAIEYRFQVLEYLHGTGSGDVVAFVLNSGIHYKTTAGTLARGQTLLDERDTQWDDREAIIFLIDDHPGLPGSKQANRYWLGALSSGGWGDHYTIVSRTQKRWLPAASTGDTSEAIGASGTGGQRFLLDAPADAASTGGSAQAESTPTITLTEMKAKVADIAQKVAAGGGSEAYRDCLYEGYRWEREVSYSKENYKRAFDEGRDYFYIRHDQSIGSGLPTGTRAFTDPYGGVGETAPAGAGEFRLMSGAAALFTTKWPGVADTARPLPAGEYKFYYSYRHQQYIICDAHPEEEKKRREVFVTVTAPAGTVHEAFFDPQTIGIGDGYISSGNLSTGDLSPAAFTTGDTTTTITSFYGTGDAVTMTLSPYVDLTTHIFDFITGDGTTMLSLTGATGDSAAGALTWGVAKQPWSSGDQLMLRISEPPLPTPIPSP